MAAKKQESNADEQPKGVECPRCGCGHAPVKYTRQLKKITLRRRECRFCGKKFTTRETTH